MRGKTVSGRPEFVSGQLVTGEILATKLRRELLSPDDALRFAIDIGEALSRAHAQGTVHGRISPQTILIVETCAVLLKPLFSERIDPAYRSPEQVLGNPPDERSDIFSFGALLYELVAGDAPFQGQGSGLDAAILEKNPPALESDDPVPQAMEKVSAGCLQKDPGNRCQRIQDAVAELKLTANALKKPVLSADPEEADESQSAHTESLSLKQRSGMRAWVMVAVALLLGVGSIAAVMLLPGRNSAPVYRFSVDQEGAKYPGMPAISPDGRSLSWSATGPDGKRMLWLQALDSAHARQVPNTEGAEASFWSPDSSYIGFFAGGSLEKVRVRDGAASGPPEKICQVDSVSGGGTWNKQGTIVFAPGLTGGLSKVSAGGGTPQALTALNAVRNEHAHLWPQFLPDGNHFIFFVASDSGASTGVYAGSLDSPNYTLLLASKTNAVYSSARSAPGYLLFIRDGSLVGQPFSASKLSAAGDAVTLAANVDAVEGLSLAQISVSGSGTLVYQSAGKAARELSWFDRTGKNVGTVGEPADWGPPRVSPDGKQIVAGKRDEKSGVAALWVMSAGGSAFQLTHMMRGSSAQPVWSPDGSRIAFASDELGTFDLYAQPASPQSQPELIYRDAHRKVFDDWSRDGKTLLFDEIIPGMARGLWKWNAIERKASTVIDTIHSEGYGALSPDGKWLAYQSDETGINEVIVQAWDNGSKGTKRLFEISKGGGALPRWRHDGRELYYITQPGDVFGVTVHPSGAELAFDPPRELFHTPPTPRSWNLFDVSPDGERFLINTPMDWPGGAKIAVVASWTKELQ